MEHSNLQQVDRFKPTQYFGYNAVHIAQTLFGKRLLLHMIRKIPIPRVHATRLPRERQACRHALEPERIVNDTAAWHYGECSPNMMHNRIVSANGMVRDVEHSSRRLSNAARDHCHKFRSPE